MGMSASQARLLSLTSRMSDLELAAQVISNAKIRLADSSAEASRAYQDALNLEKITVLNNDTSAYVDANAFNITTYGAVSSGLQSKQRFLTDSMGRILVTSTVQNAFNNAGNAPTIVTDENDNPLSANQLQNMIDLTDFLGQMPGYTDMQDFSQQNPNATAAETADAKKQLEYFTNIYTGKEAFLQSQGYTSNPEELDEDSAADGDDGDNLAYDPAAVKFYSNMYDQIEEHDSNAPGDDKMRNSEWLYEQLKCGNILLSTWDAEASVDTDGDGEDDSAGDWVNVSWQSGDSSLQIKSDKTNEAKAEAEYETTMAEIKAKDNRFDLELKQIDTEHTAIQTEMDSVKKVIEKNIERSFKIFNG